MRGHLGRLFLASITGLGLAMTSADATDMALKATPSSIGSCGEFVFTCENGSSVALCPKAVSIAGDVVTASLHTGRGSTHVRLVPMGVGYRYAGPGVWLDGFRENALLNYGKHTQIACTMTHALGQ